jgi:NitT/TauT family transport system substrate-binding protein
MAATLVALGTLLLACAPRTGAPPAPGAPAVGAQPESGTQAATQRQVDKVRLGALNSVSDAGLWIAVAKKYFEQESIDVDVSTFASAADMVAPLAGNQIDVGGGAPGVGLNNAVLRGVDIRIVADKATTSPGHGYQAVIVRKDLYDGGQIRGPADLKGRKIALPSTTGITPEAGLNVFMQRAGLTARDTDLVALAFPEMIAAFANKAIDGAVVIEPFITSIVESGSGVILERMDTVAPNQQIAVILYSSDFMQKRDLATRFMAAYLRGVRDFNDAFVKNDPAKRAEVIDILSEYTPIKEKALYDKVVMPGLDPNGRVSVESLKSDQEYYIGAKLQEQPADIDKLVDQSFVDAAVQRLGRYQ